MTGGRIARAARYIEGDDPFLATYGDGLADVDLRALLALPPLARPAVADGDGRPAPSRGSASWKTWATIEPPGGSPRSRGLDGWINAGFFVFEPPVLDYLGGDRHASSSAGRSNAWRKRAS